MALLPFKIATLIKFRYFLIPFFLHLLKKRALRNLRLEWKNWLASNPIIPVRSSVSINKIAPSKKGLILISHDLSKTGAPLVLFNLCKEAKKAGFDVVIVTLIGGELLKDFLGLAPTIELNRDFSNLNQDEKLDNLFLQLHLKGYKRCIANTVISGALAPVLVKNSISTVFLFHELIQLITDHGFEEHVRRVIANNLPIVFSSNFVKEKYLNFFELKSYSKVSLYPQGIDSRMIVSDKKKSRRKLLKQLNLPLTPNTRILLGSGGAERRKGTDLFLDIPRILHEKEALGDIHFVWLGKRTIEFEDWKSRVLPTLAYRKHIHFIDYSEDPGYIFSGADIFLLTSREDPLPSVALISIMNGTPVMCFADTGGIPEILIDYVDDVIVPQFQTDIFAEKILHLLKKDPLALEAMKENFKKNISNMSMSAYFQNLITLFES
jgi:glycosyltransferase involved in cell wall biosynthesis